MSFTSSHEQQESSRPKITLQSIQQKKGKQRITCLTAYDYPTARLLDEAGIDIALVGDSLSMVVLGQENTLAITVDEMLHHTRAVRRAVRRALVIADMPYGSYHLSSEDAVRNAARFIKEAGAEAVKVEGGEKRVGLISRLRDAEIPVMGHIGLTPQSLLLMGGYKVQGRTLGDIEQLMRDAVALERAGVFCIVLEGMPREVAAMITAEVHVPTIGIGAGPECDGQVLVLHDMLNLTFAPRAKFVRQYADVAGNIRQALESYKADVEAGSFPADQESYHLPADTRSALEQISER
ncbi:MAG TPA: 3-methyl-2-oxobutanoate hydroxymethyltransferase, partial [Terriglobales bacterium]|nr:3-methyl-2-oxobutanoate hydroxymethyltransferase [Terriglobales bacterium]